MAFASIFSKFLLTTLLAGGGIAGAIIGINSNKVSEIAVQSDISRIEQPEAASNVSEISGSSAHTAQKLNETAKESDEITTKSKTSEEVNLLGSGQNEEKEKRDVAVSQDTELDAEREKKEMENKVLNLESLKEGTKEKVKKTQKLEQKIHLSENGSQEESYASHSSLNPEIEMAQSTSNPLVAEKESDLQNNWFSIESQNPDILEQYEWSPDECEISEVKGQTNIKCPWPLSETPTTINFYFNFSSNRKLMGKNLADLQELKITPRSEETIDLGMVFSDEISREIEITLSNRKL